MAKLVGGESQVRFATKYGYRIIDQLVDGVAHKSKMGFVNFASNYKTQAYKDAYLMEIGEIKSVIWRFFKSANTGKVGLDPRLLKLLQDLVIQFKIYD